jgi:hypothetical protein
MQRRFGCPNCHHFQLLTSHPPPRSLSDENECHVSAKCLKPRVNSSSSSINLLSYLISTDINNMAKTPQPQEKDSKRSKGKGKAAKEPEAKKAESTEFSLFKSVKDAELDDLFSKSVRPLSLFRTGEG